MKKIMLLAATCVALLACSNRQDIDTPDEGTSFVAGQQVTISASAGDNVTRVAGKDDGSTINFTWEEGDQILVKVGDKTSTFALSSGAGTTSATFTGVMPKDSDHFDIQYPVTTPDLSQQTYKGDSLPAGKISFAATNCTLTETNTLKCTSSVLQINLKGGVAISKIVVETVDATPAKTYTLTTDGVYASASDTAFYVVTDTIKEKLNVTVYNTSNVGIGEFSTTNAIDLHSGKCINMPAKVLPPYGKLDGLFTVNSNGKKVGFSKGNLYCNTSTNPVTYSFESDQYDYRHYNGVSGDAAVINGTTTTTPANTVGDFAFSKDASIAYASIYAESNVTATDIFFTNATETTPNSELMVSDTKGVWRALSNSEWDYLLSTRQVQGGTGEGYSYQRARLVHSNVYGLVIWPDSYSGTKPSTFDPIPDSDWNTMEAAGCVFLPAAGYHNHVNNGTVEICDEGYYISSTPYQHSSFYSIEFYRSEKTVGSQQYHLYHYQRGRHFGISVRLVYDAN